MPTVKSGIENLCNIARDVLQANIEPKYLELGRDKGSAADLVT